MIGVELIFGQTLIKIEKRKANKFISINDESVSSFLVGTIVLVAESVELKIGERILIKKNAGTEIFIKSVQHRIVPESQIIAILDKKIKVL